MKSKGNKNDYHDLPIYVGIDVHKETWRAQICTQNTVQKSIVLERPFTENLVNYLHRHYPGADYEAVYEAGFSGFWAHKALEKAGIKTIVVHAADIPTTDKEREFKDDKRDSRKLSIALRSGELEGIFVPPLQAQKDRSLVRERWKIASSQKRVKNQIKSHLLEYGLDIPKDICGRHWSGRFISWLEEQSVELKDTALSYKIKRLQVLRRLELDIIKEIRHLSREPRFKANFDIIHSVPGIGLKNGMLLLTEIMDIHRFTTENALLSYGGMIPSSNSSGKNERTGDITKRGNRRIRTALVESCWVAIRHDSELALKYEKYAQRMKKQKAIIRIAKIMLRRIRQILLKQEKYQTRLIGSE